MKKVLIIGSGAWGTALSLAFFRAGCSVTIWSLSLDEAETINQRNENVYRLPGILLDPAIKATTDKTVASDVDIIVFVPPAQQLRVACKNFQKLIPEHIPLISASKGIEVGTNFLMTQILDEFFPKNPKGVLSGPSFAWDVARKLPTAISLAFQDILLGQELCKILGSSHFRLYASNDIIGTQIGGACKNIIAIGAGIIAGRELGENAHAALVTRGLAEMTRLGCALGAKLETFLGLSSVGDLTLTCFSEQSRNTKFGITLGKGTPLNELISNKIPLIEGYYSVTAVIKLAQQYKIEMPITTAIHELLHQNGHIDRLIQSILDRPLKIEFS